MNSEEDGLSFARNWFIYGQYKVFTSRTRKSHLTGEEDLLLLERQAQCNSEIQGSQNFLRPARWPL